MTKKDIARKRSELIEEYRQLNAILMTLENLEDKDKILSRMQKLSSQLENLKKLEQGIKDG